MRVRGAAPGNHSLPIPLWDVQLGRWPGGVEAMEAIGFNRREEAAEVVLVMDDVPEELAGVRELLEAAMRGGARSPPAGPGQAAGQAAEATAEAAQEDPTASPADLPAEQASAAPEGASTEQGDASPTGTPAATAPTGTPAGPAPTAAATNPPTLSEEQSRVAALMARALADMFQAGGSGTGQ